MPTATVTATYKGAAVAVSFEGDKAAVLIDHVEKLVNALGNRAGWATTPPAPAATSKPAADAGPLCPTHNVAMKQGRRGWYCPTKILDDGGDGRPVYCKVTR